MPEPETPDTDKEAEAVEEPKVDPAKALKEQQKRELPSNDWPGKGAA